MNIILWIVLFIATGAILVVAGWKGGETHARLKDRLKAANSCKEAHDIIFINPSEIKCPCMCGGVMEATGRNKQDTLTFLDCTKCGCCYVANDFEKKERKTS